MTTKSEDSPPPVRRLARITVDVLLPTAYFGVDLSGVEIRGIAVKDDSEMLYDVIQSSVVPARLVPVES